MADPEVAGRVGPRAARRRRGRGGRRAPARRGARARGRFAERYAGHVAELDGPGLAEAMHELAEIQELVGRAGNYAALRFSIDTADPARGALLQRVQERGTAIETKLLFFELEWAALDDERAEELLADEGLDFCRHYLRTQRRYRPHLLSEPEERLLTEKSVTGRSAWARLFTEQTSAIRVRGDGDEADRRSTSRSRRLVSPDREERRPSPRRSPRRSSPACARAPTSTTRCCRQGDRRPPARLPALAGRAATCPTRPPTSRCRRWSRRCAPATTCPSAGTASRRSCSASTAWPTTTARPRSTGEDETIAWARGARARARLLRLVLARAGGRRAPLLRRALDRRAGAPGQARRRVLRLHRPGVHPYVLLNYTARRRDVLTLAHELGHGVHAALAAPQGIFHQGTPLTMAETASVFGETVIFARLLEAADPPESRLALLAESIEGSIATVFRQMAMNRFEDLAHTARRERGRARGRALRRAVGREPGRDARRQRRDHRGLPAVVVLRARTSSTRPATSTPTPTASCSRCRSTSATRGGRGLRARATSSCWPRADRCRRRSWAGSSASTSPTRASGTRGLELVEEQLAAAEEAAREAGRM